MIAAILESGQPERLYTGLSLLVSAAAEGRPARGLVSFGALGPLLDDAPPGDDTFSRSLYELRATARELEDCRLWACAAAVELTGATQVDVSSGVEFAPGYKDPARVRAFVAAAVAGSRAPVG